MGCHLLLQDIFPTQTRNLPLLCLLQWQADSLPLRLGSTCYWLIRSISSTPQGALVVRNLPATIGDPRDAGFIPGSGRFPGRGYRLWQEPFFGAHSTTRTLVLTNCLLEPSFWSGAYSPNSWQELAIPCSTPCKDCIANSCGDSILPTSSLAPALAPSTSYQACCQLTGTWPNPPASQHQPQAP